MKIKRNVILTRPESFLRDNTSSSCFILSPNDFDDDDEWMKVAEVEFEVGIESGVIVKAAATNIDTEIGKHTAAINVLENRRNELLALTHDGAS